MPCRWAPLSRSPCPRAKKEAVSDLAVTKAESHFHVELLERVVAREHSVYIRVRYIAFARRRRDRDSDGDDL